MPHDFFLICCRILKKFLLFPYYFCLLSSRIISRLSTSFLVVNLNPRSKPNMRGRPIILTESWRSITRCINAKVDQVWIKMKHKSYPRNAKSDFMMTGPWLTWGCWALIASRTSFKTSNALLAFWIMLQNTIAE